MKAVWMERAATDSPKNILLASHDVQLIRDVERLLKENSCRVVTAVDGWLALETFRAERPDMLILDTDLPGRDWFDVVQRLNEEQLEYLIPIVLVRPAPRDEALISDPFGDTIIQRAHQVGLDCILVKPIDNMELVSFMKRMFRVEEATYSSNGTAERRKRGHLDSAGVNGKSTPADPSKRRSPKPAIEAI